MSGIEEVEGGSSRVSLSADAVRGTTASHPASVPAVLRAAADLIEPEGRWTQGVARRGKSGRYVKDPRRAVCWCVMGALDHVVGENPFDGVRSRAGVKLTVFLGESYVTFNDAPGRTQAEVVDALRKAAEHAEVSNG